MAANDHRDVYAKASREQPIGKVTHVIIPCAGTPVSNMSMRTLLRALTVLVSFSGFGFAQNPPKPVIQVELNGQKPLHLTVTLTPGAKTTVTVYRADLPWGFRYSMVYSALRPNGEPVELLLPVADPGDAEVSIQAGETLTGDIDLHYVIQDLDVLKKSDILLFWAYKSPEELRVPRWSGGLVVLPRQK